MIVYRNNSLSLVCIYYNNFGDKKFLKYLNRLKKGVEVFIKKQRRSIWTSLQSSSGRHYVFGVVLINGC